MRRLLALVLAGALGGAVLMAQVQVVNIPQQNRNGTQTSPFGQLPNDGSLHAIRFESVASDATHSNTANAITFVIYISPNGTTGNRVEVQRETWTGGTHVNKQTGLTVPNAVNLEFGPLEAYAGQFVQLEATFNRTINIGATLTATPAQ